MAFIVADRVKESTTTTGTGQLTLAGAATGFRAFSAVCADSDTVSYAVSSSGGSEWETGVGTYVASGTKLTRTTVIASSNANAAVSFSSGSKDVYLAVLAGMIPVRADIVQTTGSLADKATETGTVALGKSGLIFKVAADRGAWVRLYATSADRTADNARKFGKQADVTTNLLAEFAFSAAGTIRRLVVPYENDDSPKTTSIYYAIVNESGSTHTVAITFTVLPLEF